MERFSRNLIFEGFLKLYPENTILLISDKNNGYFVPITIYIYDNNAVNSS